MKKVQKLKFSNLLHKHADIPYDNFHQASNFAYLTGYNAPGAILVLQTTIGRDHKSTLFLPTRSHQQTVFQGQEPSHEAVRELTGFDEVLSLETDYEPFMTSLIQQSNRETQFFVNQGTGTNKETWMQFMHPALSTTKGLENVSVAVADPFIAEFRLVKSEAEQNLLRKASEISAKSLEIVRGQLDGCQNESQVAEALNFASSNICEPGAARDKAFPTHKNGRNK